MYINYGNAPKAIELYERMALEDSNNPLQDSLTDQEEVDEWFDDEEMVFQYRIDVLLSLVRLTLDK